MSKLSLHAGGINRRDVLRGMSAAALASASLPLLGGQAVAAPKKGGRFRVAMNSGGASESLNPATLNSQNIVALSWQIRNNLTEIGPNGKLVGEIAESWEAKDGGKTWIFKLRKGIEFHNGKTLTAKDVVESYNHHRGDDSKSLGKSLVDTVTNISADGDSTVVFTLSIGNADFPYATQSYYFPICPAKEGGGIDWQSGIGTGAFKLSRFEPGISSLVTRNPNYWKAGRGHFDEVEMFTVTDVSARTAGIRSGRFDAMQEAEYKTANPLQAMRGLRLVITPGNSHAALAMACNKAPFDNPDLRRAMKFAIDRQQWVDTIFSGFATLGNDSPIGPANRYRATAEEMPQRRYDPDQAKFYLKKAGMETVTLPLSTSGVAFPGAVDAAALYRESAAKCGINLQIIREPDDGYWSNVMFKKPFFVGHWSGASTEDIMFSMTYLSTARLNETFWKNEKFDSLLLQARGELDESKRREMYVEMQRITHDDAGEIIPIFKSYVDVVTDKVGMDATVGNDFALDGLRAAERWWFV